MTDLFKNKEKTPEELKKKHDKKKKVENVDFVQEINDCRRGKENELKKGDKVTSIENPGIKYTILSIIGNDVKIKSEYGNYFACSKYILKKAQNEENNSQRRFNK